MKNRVIKKAKSQTSSMKIKYNIIIEKDIKIGNWVLNLIEKDQANNN